MQAPVKSDPTPTPTPTASTTASTSDGLTQPTSTQEIQLVWQDATTMLVEILLTSFKSRLGYNYLPSIALVRCATGRNVR